MVVVISSRPHDAREQDLCKLQGARKQDLCLPSFLVACHSFLSNNASELDKLSLYFVMLLPDCISIAWRRNFSSNNATPLDKSSLYFVMLLRDCICVIHCLEENLTKLGMSRKATKMTMEISRVLTQGSFNTMSSLPCLPVAFTPSAGGYEPLQSKTSILNEIMHKLKDNNMYMIEVYEIGGVGESTLIKEVAWQAEHSDSFDAIIVATITNQAEYLGVIFKLFLQLLNNDISHEFALKNFNFKKFGKVSSHEK